jgi:S1-C subfamily serine protease
MRSIRLAAAVSLAAVAPAFAQPPAPLPAKAAPPAAQEAAKRGYLGVMVSNREPDSVAIERLDPQGAAAAAGLKAGDVIIKVDGQAVPDQIKLNELVNAKRAGQTVLLSVRGADGNVVEKQVTLRDRPMPTTRNYAQFDDDPNGNALRIDEMIRQAQFGQPPMGPRPMLGVTVFDADPGLRDQLKMGNVNGAVIGEVRPGTPAADAKLQVNDVVTAIDATAVASAAELQRVIASAKPDSKVTLKVFRDGKTIDVPVTIKTMTTPSIPGIAPGFGGRMPALADPFAEIRALKQRIDQLEARVRVLEDGRGPATQPPPQTKPPAQPPSAKSGVSGRI